MPTIDPVATPAIWPWMQEPFGDWLFTGFKKEDNGHYSMAPLPSYQGPLTADPNQTRMPDVAGAWQPYDAGTSFLLDYFANNRGGIGQQDPRSTQMMKWGGTGGIGNNYMNLMAQYGTPSQVGQPLQSMIQTGSAGGSGANLANFASGNPVGPAAFLAPFLTGQQRPNSYQAPPIVGRQVQRRA